MDEPSDITAPPEPQPMPAPPSDVSDVVNGGAKGGSHSKGQGEEAIELEPFRSTNNAGYRGVKWISSRRNYQATIRVNGHSRHLGSFDTAEEAARAHVRAYLRKHEVEPKAEAKETEEQEDSGKCAVVRTGKRRRNAPDYKNLVDHASHPKPGPAPPLDVPIASSEVEDADDEEDDDDDEEDVALSSLRPAKRDRKTTPTRSSGSESQGGEWD